MIPISLEISKKMKNPRHIFTLLVLVLLLCLGVACTPATIERPVENVESASEGNNVTQVAPPATMTPTLVPTEKPTAAPSPTPEPPMTEPTEESEPPATDEPTAVPDPTKPPATDVPTAEPTVAAPTEVPVDDSAETIRWETWYIDSKQVDCVGVAPQKCLLIKTDPNAEYEYFYDVIEGFEWQAGHEYELKVKITDIENPPADASSIRVELVEIVNDTEVAMSTSPDPMLGTKWDLVSINGQPNNTGITLEFTIDGTGGSDGCNGYGATYTINGEQLSFDTSGFMSTMMACDPQIMEAGDIYLTALQTAKTFALNGSQLVIYTDNGELLFRQPVALTVENTRWVLNSTLVGGDAVVSLAIDSDIFMQLTEGNASGSAGCNNFNGSYVLDGAALSFGPLATTRMLCEDERNARETEILEILTKTAQFKIERSELQLFDADWQFLAAFYAE